MKTLICAGFGRRLSRDERDFIDGLGFNGIRQDVAASDGTVDPEALVANVEGMDTAIFVLPIHRAANLAGLVARTVAPLGSEVIIEVGNEVDLLPEWTPPEFARTVSFVSEEVDAIAPAARVITGGISNLSRKALRWLRLVVENGLPPHVGLGFHSYRDDVWEAKDGFETRGREMEELLDIAHGRPLYHTEGGWHTAPRPRRFPFCWQTTALNDYEVGHRLAADRTWFGTFIIETYTVYQLNDGPTDTAIDRYGLRDRNGHAKPSALVFSL